MNLLLPHWLDAILIAPFQAPAHALWGFWLGCIVLAGYCVLLGELTSAVLYLVNRRFYAAQQDAMTKAHNLSVEALHSGDKESYKAVNRQAHEAFGKAFFAQAALGIASLWPVPFAMAWLNARFEGVPIIVIPYWDHPLYYPFVLILSYIPLRVLFARYKRHLPLFCRVVAFQEAAKKARGEMRSFFRAHPTPQ